MLRIEKRTGREIQNTISAALNKWEIDRRLAEARERLLQKSIILERGK